MISVWKKGWRLTIVSFPIFDKSSRDDRTRASIDPRRYQDVRRRRECRVRRGMEKLVAKVEGGKRKGGKEWFSGLRERMGRRSKGRGWGGGAISAARDWGSLLGEQKLHLQMNSRDKSHNFSGLSRSYRGFCQPQPSFSFLTWSYTQKMAYGHRRTQKFKS